MSERERLIKRLVDSQFDYSLTPEEREEKKQQLNDLSQEIIQPQLKENDAVSYGGVNFYKDKEKMKEDQREFFESPVKKEPLAIEPAKEEKKLSSIQEGFKFPSRNKLMRMEGEEESTSSPSILDKLLKRERESSPDVAVRRQVWNPELGTYELSRDTSLKRPFLDNLLGSPEIRAAGKVEQYSKLKLDDEERAKQLDSSGKRTITKSPLLESFERLLQLNPEEGRQIAAVSGAPTSDEPPAVSEIKSIKEQKISPVSKSSISTGTKEDESPEAKLNEVIKAESEQVKKPEMDFNEMLRMAQESRDKSQLLANIGKASELFATGLTGTVPMGRVTKPVAQDFYDKLIKQAEQPIEDVGATFTIKTKQDEMGRLARRRDPSSEESKFARALLKQQGIDIPETATAEALEKYAPQLTNILTQREAREARAASAKERALDRAALLEKGYSEKQEKAIMAARDQVMSKGYKDAFDMYKNAERISNTFENLSAGMYGDTIRTLQSAKLFQGDASVVRGPELKEIQSAVGVLDRLKNEVDRLGGTAKLQPKQRQELLNAVNTIKNVAKKEYTGLLGPAAKQFNRRGLPLDEIFDPRVLPEVQESLGIKSEKEEQKTKNQIKLPKDKRNMPGKKIEYSGKIYVIDPSGETATEE